MFQTLWEVVHRESIGIVLGATAALVTTWFAAYRRRRREMSEINRGHQFQQLEFAYAFVTNNGRSAWFVGALLLMVYSVFAMTLYVMPPRVQ